MRSTFLVIAAAASFALAPSVRATMLFSDSFDYTVGTPPNSELGHNVPGDPPGPPSNPVPTWVDDYSY
ncbi:MAG TPA: hypothetical protein VG722_00720, partial [Tepidisphaeraceae bacterium]|nr:hypothetical protein [Tepidisphaeraceae bacterium]